MSWIETLGSVSGFMLFLPCIIQFAQQAKLSSVCHKDHMQTTLLPQGVEESYNRLPYSNIQIGFKLSWTEPIGSVLDSMSFSACSLHCAQMAILFSVCHKDHMQTTRLPQGVEESYNWLLYSNIQIGFVLSWIESIGSVLDSMSFLPCSLQCAQMAILFSAWHKDHI